MLFRSVYKARRPFHPGRMLTFLRKLPIKRGIPLEDEETATVTSKKDKDQPEFLENISDDVSSTLNEVLRSKGFVWCADSHDNAMYWSHAGSSFEYKCLGQWWATLPRSQWPDGVEEYVLRDYDDPMHTEGEDNDDATATTVGDRRQEIVFIGVGFGSAKKQNRIKATLDQCLLSDSEYDEYRSIALGNEKADIVDTASDCCDKCDDKSSTSSNEPSKSPLEKRFPNNNLESIYVNY